MPEKPAQKRKIETQFERVRVTRVNGWPRAIIIRDHPNARCYTVMREDTSTGKFKDAQLRMRQIINDI